MLMPKVIKPLTNTEVDKAKIKDKEYNLTDGQGLILRIKPTGAKTWLFNYYHPTTKKRTSLTIGTYPSVTLAQARIKREEFRALLAQDIDPQEKAKEEEQAISEQLEHSFLSVAQKWKEKKAQEVEALTLKKNWRRLEMFLLPAIQHIAVEKISPSIVIQALQPLSNQQKGDTLRRTIRLLNEVLNFAVNYGLISFNPCLKLNEVFSFGKVTNNPAINPSELATLMKTVMWSSCAIQTKMLFKFQLLTMTRPSEASGAIWKEMDLAKALWTIPASRMKKRKDFTIPLSSQSIDILEKMKAMNVNDHYVFESWIKPNQPLSSQTINKMLVDLGFKNKQTAHGLRSIGRTYLEEQGIDYAVAEMCLSHSTGSQTSLAYNRSDYLEQRRIVMQIWGDYVEKCEKTI